MRTPEQVNLDKANAHAKAMEAFQDALSYQFEGAGSYTIWLPETNHLLTDEDLCWLSERIGQDLRAKGWNPAWNVTITRDNYWTLSGMNVWVGLPPVQTKRQWLDTPLMPATLMVLGGALAILLGRACT